VESSPIFLDRHDAGRRLARELLRFKDRNPVALALPRGGVPVGFEVAAALAAPLDVVLVRKLGVPQQPELAFGAVIDGTHPERVLDKQIVEFADVPAAFIEAETARQVAEIERRRKLYLKGRAPLPLEGRTAIVLDDGIATGSTMRAALIGVRGRRPAHLVLAVPVAPPSTLATLRGEVDEVVCLGAPEAFGAIGCFYRDFHQMSDDEVIELLDRAARAGGAPATAPTTP
jgi:putative phosphoribosyl transferase